MAASPKAPLRTSEDVFNRLRWDPSLAGEGEGAEAQVWIGFEDRILGPLEVKLEEFVPMSEGGPRTVAATVCGLDSSSLICALPWTRSQAEGRGVRGV